MKIKKGYILREVGNEGIVVTGPEADKDFKGIIKLNSTGLFLWKMLEKGTDRASLTEALIKQYEIDSETAENAVSSFLGSVIKNGFADA